MSDHARLEELESQNGKLRDNLVATIERAIRAESALAAMREEREKEPNVHTSMLPVQEGSDGVHRESATLQSVPCVACQASTFTDGRHQRDDTRPPYCALCGSGRPAIRAESALAAMQEARETWIEPLKRSDDPDEAEACRVTEDYVLLTREAADMDSKLHRQWRTERDAARAKVAHLTEELDVMQAKLRGLPPTVAAGLIQRLQDENAALAEEREGALEACSIEAQARAIAEQRLAALTAAHERVREALTQIAERDHVRDPNDRPPLVVALERWNECVALAKAALTSLEGPLRETR